MQRFACYDFNYAVLTTRASFSYGNLLPCVMQEHGAVLIGEPTGGGSCSVQMSVLTGGDYTPFFDEVMLDQMINEWFEAQAEAPAA